MNDSRLARLPAAALLPLLLVIPVRGYGQVFQGPAEIPDSETFLLAPADDGDPYHLVVALPASYGTHPHRRYPVLYLTDGDVARGTPAEIARFLASAGRIPEIITVGVGYGADLAEWRSRRGSDLRPPLEGLPEPARADRFLEFLTKRVIPFVEGRYRTVPDRGLWGYSLGGLFGSWVLMRHPGTFHRYILGSPSYGATTRRFTEWAASLNTEQPPPTGRVYTSVGVRESRSMRSNWRTVWDAVERHAPAGLRIVRSEPGQHHVAGAWTAMSEGMEAVYRDDHAGRDRGGRR